MFHYNMQTMPLLCLYEYLFSYHLFISSAKNARVNPYVILAFGYAVITPVTLVTLHTTAVVRILLTLVTRNRAVTRYIIK